MLEKELKKLGLDKNEAKIYLSLLELGPSGISEIAQKAEMNRTTLYSVFDRLIEKGLLSISISGKRRVYTAESPGKVKQIIKDQLAVLDELMPELLSRVRTIKNKPVFRYLDGLEGIKIAFLDSLKTKDETIIGFSGIEALTVSNKSLLRFWENEYIPKRKKLKKFVRLILPENEIGQNFKDKDAEHFRESKMVPGSRYNFECEIHTYDDIVTVVSYSQGEEFALEIKSKPIANTIKMIFQIVWTVGY